MSYALPDNLVKAHRRRAEEMPYLYVGWRRDNLVKVGISACPESRYEPCRLIDHIEWHVGRASFDIEQRLLAEFAPWRVWMQGPEMLSLPRDEIIGYTTFVLRRWPRQRVESFMDWCEMAFPT